MTQRFVVTGTDTDIGKSVFAAGLVRLLDGAYWKPVQAGLNDGTDSTRVAALAGLPPARILPEAYRLTTPCSPHAAAAKSSRRRREPNPRALHTVCSFRRSPILQTGEIGRAHV